MRNLIFLLFLISIFAACDHPKPATPQNLDLEGFTIQDIPGAADIKRATLRDVKGKILEEGTIKDGRKHGIWTTYHKDRDVVASIGSYVNGVPNGPVYEFGSYGHLEKISNFTNNVLDGRFVTMKNTHKIEEGTYGNGILEGNFKKYYENKDVVQQEMNYKHNKLDGDVIYYNDKGEVTMRYVYKDGEKISGGMVEAKQQ